MALITVSDLKTYLGISVSTEDAYLAVLVAGLDKSVKKWLKRNIEQLSSQTEYYDGHGFQKLFLKNRPVTAVASVKVDGGGYYGQVTDPVPFGALTLLTQGVDWVIQSTAEEESNQSCLIKLRGVWPEGFGNVQVVCTHGYATIPDDIKLACYMLAGGMRQARTTGGFPLASETLGDYSYSLLSGAQAAQGWESELVQAVGLLKPYRQAAI